LTGQITRDDVAELEPLLPGRSHKAISLKLWEVRGAGSEEEVANSPEGIADDRLGRSRDPRGGAARSGSVARELVEDAGVAVDGDCPKGDGTEKSAGDASEREGAPRGRRTVSVLEVDGVRLSPGSGVTIVAADRAGSDVMALVEACLSASPGASGTLEINSADGNVLRVSCHDGTWREGGVPVSREYVACIAGIGEQGKPRVEEDVERQDVGSVEGSLVHPDSGVTGAIMREMGVAAEGDAGGGVQVPLWLLDLSLRLCSGEQIICVRPGDMWQRVAAALSRRDVQAFVVGPGSEARALGYAVLQV
jgi:hypothetical protein